MPLIQIAQFPVSEDFTSKLAGYKASFEVIKAADGHIKYVPSTSSVALRTLTSVHPQVVLWTSS